MKNVNQYFEGWYFKHQKGQDTIALIPGIADGGAFIQVATNSAAYHFDYGAADFHDADNIVIGGNSFSPDGIQVDIRRDGAEINGAVKYKNLTPIKYDLMGPLKYLPLECRHGVVSMRHDLSGWLDINGRTVDLTGGAGYIEKDSGLSFPRSYLWIHCNDLPDGCSVMAAAADVPLLGRTQRGCAAIVYYGGREYRLATYLGGRATHCEADGLILKQGGRVLDVDIYGAGKSGANAHTGLCLRSPKDGRMTGSIVEHPAIPARLRFFIRGKKVFDFDSKNVSYEYVD